jgi:hypothetical protein
LASGLRPHRDGRKWLISELYGPFDASGYSVSGSIYMVESSEGHQGPRRNLVLQHQALTERIIGLGRHSVVEVRGPTSTSLLASTNDGNADRSLCPGLLAIGLLLNFHAARLKDGLRRFVG